MKKENGVTLIATAVTTIIICILAAASLSLLFRGNNIIETAKEVSESVDYEKIELGISEILQSYMSEYGYKARAKGIDKFLMDKGYVEKIKVKQGTSVYLRIDIEELVDGEFDTGTGFDENDNDIIEKSEYKDFYYIEPIKKSENTASLELFYINKNDEKVKLYEFEEIYNIDVMFADDEETEKENFNTVIVID